jgi:hypothetical protein
MRSAVTATAPASPGPKVSLLIRPVSRSSTVSAWTVTRPAAPMELASALLKSPAGEDAAGLPTMVRRPAVTATAPASPAPKVALAIAPVSRSSRVSARTVTRPAEPVAPGKALLERPVREDAAGLPVRAPEALPSTSSRLAVAATVPAVPVPKTSAVTAEPSASLTSPALIVTPPLAFAPP